MLVFHKVGKFIDYMIDYDSIENAQKQVLKNQLLDNATSIGGKNHFLSLIDAIWISGPNPLMAKDASFQSNKSLIKWNKVIYKDNVHLLMKFIQYNGRHQNLTVKEGDRNYKEIKNLFRTISPIKFVVKPKNKKNGDGFVFNFIDIINKNTCQLSFMFEVMFTLPIKLIKKIFNAQS